MKRRRLISMNDEEMRAFLEEQRTVQVATIDHDGWPHLVAMWYVLINGQIVFWTYAKSQKAVNLRRNARLTCLIESGESYNELRGVQIKGEAIISDERETVQRVGEVIWERYSGGALNDATRQMVVAQAAKRVVVFVKPVEVVSWDHRKLGGGY
ncbi:MAG: TIGR03618 family F420-dependent PPOX class oxidoreductase [Ktedonobacteraceae bacterium]|nr:TIGR03618 family F420-dependent PPOX class oxidoreductase [Ktedonobacteraceae bacterium]MBO0795177.1 TIGR03618 family F420-dependent PPOX class oxidoreductase [Ktedonobacteraceae bacterium]